MTTAKDVREALKTVDFPADKASIIQAAEETGASADVIKALRGMPPEVEYANKDEVVRSAHI